MSITLKDIADEVGVSISTVSRALSSDMADKVKPATKSRIHDAMKRLGYNISGFQESSPSFHANYSVGIILASSDKSFSHPFFAEMLSALQHEFYKTNYFIEYILAESSMPEDKFRDTIINSSVSGAILLGRMDPKLLNFFKSNIPSLVYTGVNYVGHDTDEVICNGYDAVATLYEHFFSLGYQKIAYIGPINTSSAAKNDYQRFNSYEHCLELYHSPACKDHIQIAMDTMEDGYAAMCRIINSRNLPDAIICASDSTAIGVMRAAAEHEIKIPDDIAIAGIDNIQQSQFLVPSLTTVNVPKSELSRLAVNMLLDKIQNKRQKNIRLDIPHDLIIRESCGFRLRRTQISNI